MLPTPSRENTLLDPDLIGVWGSPNAAPIEITAQAQILTVDNPVAYNLSADGQTLTYPGTSPVWQANRLFGDAGSVVGLWERHETDAAGAIWREEWHLRSDGTYGYHWTVDGQFDSNGDGRYTADATHITTKERRAQISTGPGNHMVMTQFYGPTQIGTYAKSADLMSWTFSTASGDSPYSRLP